MRYEAVKGFNTKQWWLYDTETDEFCDPPSAILDKIELMPCETTEQIDAQETMLELLANSNNDWINDKAYRYQANEIEI